MMAHGSTTSPGPAGPGPAGQVRPLVLTMGEPAGIGGEITLKAWRTLWSGTARTEAGSRPVFCVLDDIDRLRREAARCGLDVPVRAIDGPEAAAETIPEALPVLHRPLATAVEPGRAVARTANDVIGSIEEAVRLVIDGMASAVVTNPIQKSALYAAGFQHPGHTEFLAALAADPDGPMPRPVMMLAVEGLRVIPATIHVPLAEVPARLSRDLIVETGRIAADSLRRDFGIPRPRIAIAGLNPHAGEGGTIGREDEDIVAPAVAALRAEGIETRGPLSADTLFHAAARRGYDLAICQYHDQALIPIKTLDFDRGVNVTLGLPFVRTSPDHGTALDIAGQGVASPESLVAALRLAAEMARNRQAATGSDRRVA